MSTSPFMNAMIEWSDGNPGAAIFLVGLFKAENIHNSLSIMAKIEGCKSIRGTNLYVLFNDLCDKDYNTVAILCRKCPDKILEDACKRQDYSGKDLVKSYLK